VSVTFRTFDLVQHERLRASKYRFCLKTVLKRSETGMKRSRKLTPKNVRTRTKEERMEHFGMKSEKSSRYNIERTTVKFTFLEYATSLNAVL
jgi:hypothetical protein